MKPKILVLGKNGQLGRALISQLGVGATGLGRSECDLRDPEFTRALEPFADNISAVINASAYTQVDKAETEGRDEAFRVNGVAAGELGAWCKVHGVPLVHVSTDYVFDGRGDAPHREEDAAHPLNAYGESKLAGERALANVRGDYLTFRTSWVYDATGNNFCTKMLSLFREKTTLKVVGDQVGAPTYAPHLARALLAALAHAQGQSIFPSGVYHLCNSGFVSRYDNVLALLALAKKYDPKIVCKEVEPVATSAFPMPAARPLNSRLDCSKAANVLKVVMPDWQVGMSECVERFYAGA